MNIAWRTFSHLNFPFKCLPGIRTSPKLTHNRPRATHGTLSHGEKNGNSFSPKAWFAPFYRATIHAWAYVFVLRQCVYTTPPRLTPLFLFSPNTNLRAPHTRLPLLFSQSAKPHELTRRCVPALVVNPGGALAMCNLGDYLPRALIQYESLALAH